MEPHAALEALRAELAALDARRAEICDELQRLLLPKLIAEAKEKRRDRASGLFTSRGDGTDSHGRDRRVGGSYTGYERWLGGR